MDKNIRCLIIFSALLINSAEVYSGVSEKEKLKEDVEFISNSLNEIKKTGIMISVCESSVVNKEVFSLDELVEDLNSEIDILIKEIQKMNYREPNLKIRGLTKSQNIDLNVIMDNAISYAKKVQKNPNGNYEVPVIKIHGLNKDQEKELNKRYKSEILARPPGGGDGMGIVGVTFVIAAGMIVGVAIPDRNTILAEPGGTDFEDLDRKGLEPYRASAESSITLTFEEIKKLLDSKKNISRKWGGKNN